MVIEVFVYIYHMTISLLINVGNVMHNLAKGAIHIATHALTFLSPSIVLLSSV